MITPFLDDSWLLNSVVCHLNYARSELRLLCFELMSAIPSICCHLFLLFIFVLCSVDSLLFECNGCSFLLSCLCITQCGVLCNLIESVCRKLHCSCYFKIYDSIDTLVELNN